MLENSTPIDHLSEPVTVRPHVLLVLRGFENDGPGRLVLEVLRQWSAADLRVSAAADRAEGPLLGPMSEELERLGGRVHQVRMPLTGDHGAAELARVAEMVGATVLHAHLIRADMAARGAARLANLPCVVTEHGIHAWSEKGRLLRPVLARWYRRSLGPDVHIIAISRKVRRDLRDAGIPGRKITVVENGVDPTHFQPASPSLRAQRRAELGLPADARPVVLMMGALIERKSPATALEAFALLRRHLPGAILLIGGEGPLKRSLQDRARGLHLGHHVRFAGHADALTLLQSADLLVHPSRDEPYGLAVAEALSCGVPVVARAGAGADQLLPPGAYCSAVDGNRPEAWAMALLNVWETASAEAEGCAKACREHAVEKLHIRRTAEGYAAVYRGGSELEV